MRRIAAIPLCLLLGCVVARPQPFVPEGGRLAIGETFPPIGRWSCEGGEELVLTRTESGLGLHVASSDILALQPWSEGGRQHFALDYRLLDAGLELVVPTDANDDASIALYRRLGGHVPVNPAVRSADGSPLPRMAPYGGFADGRPTGDPWSREMCWAPKGPLATAAKERGVKPRDLLYFGARIGASPPAGALPIALDSCLGEAGFADAPIGRDLWYVPGKDGVAGRIYFRTGVDGFVVDEAVADEGQCLIRYADGQCLRADKAREQGAVAFYWEHVQTGFRIVWTPAAKTGLLTVFSPGDLRPAPAPPKKTAIAGPLSMHKNARAFDCLLKGG